MEGNGKMLITAVGINSQTGIIMTLLGASKGIDSISNSSRCKYYLRQLNSIEIFSTIFLQLFFIIFPF